MQKDIDFKIESTNNLILLAYVEDESEIYWNIIAELHSRGSWREFEIAKNLTISNDPIYREIGADILGQLGFSQKKFHQQSVEILINLLNDVNEDVIASSAFSLGHRNDIKAVPFLTNLLNHLNSRVRNGVAFGLSCLENIDAIKGLIYLTNDNNEDVRNWATFGLGNQCEMDLPEIREALYQRL
ncbi:HEAT repeat domain-containing protein, partial [Acinetobacter sp. P8-3-8]|uniref:HEAT repeat domain-containing protein n=1 Tax=Acinetobacter sp. P8-3-8 TaxID=1029823 RepID=UPI0002486CD0